MNSLQTDALSTTRSALNELLRALRERIGETGRDADRYQQICFDVARSAAEVAAAEALLEDARSGDLQQELAHHFLGATAHSLETRLRAARAELGLESFRAAPEALASCGEEEALGARLLASGARFDDALLDGEHRLIRDSYRAFAEAHVEPRAEEIHRQDTSIPADLLEGLADLGCFGLSIPEKYGGLTRDDAPDCLSMLLATEELSRGSLGAAGSLITRPEVLAKALLAGGTEEQKSEWLPALAKGERLCAVAVTEPDYGSDVASMKLRATRADEGFRLSGSKMWCTFAGRAHVLMVLARTGAPESGHRGLSLFLVEKPSFDGHDFEVSQDGGGVLKGRAISTLGYRGMHSYELFFDDFLVPEGNLVGGTAGEGKGFYLTMAGFAGGRIQTAARAVGVMQAAFEKALDYARQRHTFGRPIGDYQLIRVKLARMASLLHATRVLTYSAAPLMDRGAGDVPAAMAKLLASSAAETVTREALQIHGGIGYAEESAVSRYWVDARVLSIFEGSEEILALKVIARSLLEGA
jgi:(2S)-methylsuccinyl-CoA dehydrogenase